MRKIYKTVETDKYNITYYGSNRAIQLQYAKPEWSEYAEAYFMYEGLRNYLSEFMSIGQHAPDHMKEFDGYSSDSFFSGVVVKIDDDAETVKAYTYIS